MGPRDSGLGSGSRASGCRAYGLGLRSKHVICE